uniref:Uncharacterized protein n=1 Tax=Arundo donax TaxID=35708 RepID=A0A0A8ZKN3_ARUDO
MDFKVYCHFRPLSDHSRCKLQAYMSYFEM